MSELNEPIQKNYNLIETFTSHIFDNQKLKVRVKYNEEFDRNKIKTLDVAYIQAFWENGKEITDADLYYIHCKRDGVVVDLWTALESEFDEWLFFRDQEQDDLETRGR